MTMPPEDSTTPLPGPHPTNRLARETSPYLLQHAHNPVDWYPWGEEALARARELDRPIFLSIGYAACHWCHVMERESFEDEATADDLNASFVAIKVDREERPDLDAVYMDAVQAMTGQGGWPMSVFLDARRTPVLRRHVLPRQATPRHPLVPPAAGPHRRGLARSSGTRSRQPPLASPSTSGRTRSRRPACSRPWPKDRRVDQTERLRAAMAELERDLRRATRRLGRRAEVPAADDHRAPAARAPPDGRPRAAVDGPANARCHGRRRHLRPSRRRLRAVLDRRRLARAALREDALRQRPAGPGVQPRVRR